MLYRSLKILISIAIRAYFRKIRVRNLELIPTDAPLLFVANHPSAFMDPLCIASNVKQELHFLVRGESFQNPVSRFVYGRVNMIPVYRASETPDEVHKNKDIFAFCFKHLAKSGSIIIFPEGSSKTEPRLRPIKTGAARIALGADAEHDFKLGVKIIPIGVNYSDSHSFRSNLFLNIGEPIEMSEYEEAYKNDERETVNELTERIKDTLKANTLVIDNEQLDDLIANIEKIYKSKLRQDREDELPQADADFLISKEIIEGVQYHHKHEPLRVERVKEMIDKYLENLHRYNIKDKQLKPERRQVSGFESALFLLFGFPIFLLGFITNLIPYKLTGAVARKVTQRGDFFGSVQLLSGLVTFLLFYSGYIVLAAFFVPWWATLAIAFAIPIAGLVTLAYLKHFMWVRGTWMITGLFLRKKDQIARLTSDREEIIAELEKGRLEFVAWRDKQG